MYPFRLITEAFKRVVNTKQKYNEIIVDYSKRLKQGKSILEAHVGKYVLGRYVENINELKNAIGADNKGKIKYEELINWWRTY